MKVLRVKGSVEDSLNVCERIPHVSTQRVLRMANHGPDPVIKLYEKVSLLLFFFFSSSLH